MWIPLVNIAQVSMGFCLAYDRLLLQSLFASNQFNHFPVKDYYGMRHELIEYISSEEIFQDLNDETGFKLFKLSELLTESKTVFYFPDYLLQVRSHMPMIYLIANAEKPYHAHKIFILFHVDSEPFAAY